MMPKSPLCSARADVSIQVASLGPLCAREDGIGNVFEDPARPAEQRDAKVELLVLCLAFNMGDAALALAFAEGHYIQSCKVRERKCVR